MPRRAAPTITSLYADLTPSQMLPGHLTSDGALTWATLMGQTDLAASLRRDLAGAPLSMMRSPVTYQSTVTACWGAYHSDPLFKMLIDRVVDFVATGAKWEVHDDPLAERSWPSRIRSWFSREDSAGKQAEVWNAWDAQINLPAPNTPQGMTQIVQWAARHCLLSGMFVPHWQWGSFKYGKKVYLMPTQLTCYPGSMITLRRQQQEFMSEQILLLLSGEGMPMSGMNQVEAPMTALMSSPNLIPLEPIGARSVITPGVTEAFALKYRWAPGDLSTTRIGPMQQTGWGQYPAPPFKGLLPQFALRQKLFAADLAIADAVASYQKVFRVGDKDNPLKEEKRDAKTGRILQKGTLSEIATIIQAGLANPALALYLPYWVAYELKLPEIGKLLSDDKYVSSQTEIFNAFGLLSSRSPAARNEKYGELNLAAFEELLDSLRELIGAFMQRLAMRIVEVNGSAFSVLPVWQPDPLNTKSKEFKDMLIQLAKFGRISTTTLLENLGLNAEVEKRRIAQDAAQQADDLYDDNVPVSFVQTTDTKGATPNMPERDRSVTPPALPAGGESGDGGEPAPAEPAPAPEPRPKRRHRKTVKISSPPGRPRE